MKPDLIGYYLGLIEDSETQAIEAQLAASPQLRAELESLVADLEPLGSLTVLPPGRNLADRILDRVQHAPRLVTGGMAGSMNGSMTAPHGFMLNNETSASRGGSVSLVELIGLAAAIMLMVGVALPAYQEHRTKAAQLACLSNMRKLGQANASYANMFAGAFPFAGSAVQPWLKNTSDREQFAGNSRHVFLLLKTPGLADSSDFVCAGRQGDEAMDMSLVDANDDFPSVKNVGFSSPLAQEALYSSRCDVAFPMLADHNPQFINRVYQSRSILNSDSHGRGAGQNVLRIDGGAGWTDRTNVGPAGDDIMSLVNFSSYTGQEFPYFKSDTMLVP